jgi:DNA-binding transcriptional LysR family regulator
MDKYQQMRVFYAVVDVGSFVAAAETLSMSKAAVSRYVSDLEKRLGVRLLHRTTRKLSVTPEGEVFFARCRDILSSIDASELEISTHSETASGILKLSVPVSFGLLHLAPLWSEFLASYPEVGMDVQLTDRVTDLVDEGFDLAVRIARLPDSSLVSRQLASTRLVLSASPAYLHRCGVPRHPSELTQHTVIGYSLLAMGDQWQFNGPQGLVNVKVRPRLWSNNGNICLAAALRGTGIQLQPSFLVADALASGQLVEVLPEFPSVELGIYAVYPSRRFVLPKVRALIAFLSTKLAHPPWMRDDRSSLQQA